MKQLQKFLRTPQVFYAVLCIEVVITVHSCQAHEQNYGSGKSLRTEPEEISDYKINYAITSDDQYNENGEDYDNFIGHEDEDELDNNYKPIMLSDTSQHHQQYRRGIKAQEELNDKGIISKDRNKTNRRNPDGNLDPFVGNHYKIKGPLQEFLISKYAEAHKHIMKNKFHRQRLNSIKGAMDIMQNNSMENSSNTNIIKKTNKHSATKQDLRGNNEYDLAKIPYRDLGLSVINNSAEVKDDNSHSDMFGNPYDSGKEIKITPEEILGKIDERVNGNLRKHKKKNKANGSSILRENIGEGAKSGNDFDNDIRRNYINRLVKIESSGQDGSNNSIGEHYANMSMINNGFLNAIEKKYFTLNNGALTKYKPKPSVDFDSANNSYRSDFLVRNYMPSNKSITYETDYKTPLRSKMIGNSRLGEEKPKGLNTTIAVTESNLILDRNMYHNLETKNRFNMMDYKSYEHTTTKDKVQETNRVESAPNLDDGEKQIDNDVKSRRKSHIKSNRKKDQIDQGSNRIEGRLDSGIKFKRNGRRRDTLKKNNYSKDRSKLRNERDVENNKFTKYRIGVDSRGRSRVMVSDVNDYKSSGTRPEYYDKSGSRGDMIRPYSFKHNQPQNIKESNEELTEDVVNEVQDNADNEEVIDYGGSHIEDVDGKKIFARRAHPPTCNDDEKSATDNCVEYKGGKCTSESTTFSPLTGLTDSKIITSKKSSKERTTPKPNENPQGAKSKSADSDPSESTSYKELDDYEQFLTGLFAEKFVKSVLLKVQRSRKIANELGFGNYTDESCDRCLETKPNIMPDLGVLRKSLNNLPKSDQKKNPQVCYKVPDKMDDFLSILISYEKEQESSAYKSIQEESGFIFTGDDSEPSFHVDKIDGDERVSEEYDAVGKDTFEKQHLREDENEYKNDDKMSGKDNEPISHTLSHKGCLGEKELTDKDVNVDDDSLLISDMKTSKNSKTNYNTEINSQNDENHKGNSIDEEMDSKEDKPARYRNNVQNNENVLDTSNSKQRRQSYKSEEVPGLSLKNLKFGLSLKHPLSKVDTGDVTGVSDIKSRVHHNERGNYRPFKSNLFNRYQLGHREKDHLQNAILPRIPNTLGNDYGNPNAGYDYPQAGYSRREELKPLISNNRPYLSSDVDLMDGDEEYQLYPNSNGDELPVVNPMTDYEYHKADYGRSSRMVKRNADERNEDGIIFFEVPDEYELY